MNGFRKILGAVIAATAAAGLAVFFALQGSAFIGQFTREAEEKIEIGEFSRETSLHIAPPEEVRGMYLAAPTIRNGERFDALIALAHAHGINTLVIDLQFIDGDVAFTPRNAGLLLGKRDDGIRYDLDAVTRKLHERGMYVIGRALVFQNTAFAETYPQEATKRPDGALWRDRLGGAWVDPGSKRFLQYLYGLAEEAYAHGVDEINLDYIRFPSDGPVQTTRYPLSNAESKGTTYKNELLGEVFNDVGNALHTKGIPVSVDLFGQTLWQDDGLGIGQKFIPAAAAFDVVMPMTYPSHFAAHFMGFKKPVEHPFEVVHKSAVHGGARLETASSTARATLRFWIQAFDHKKKYTPTEVGEQIRAVREAGARGWVLWNARNEYERFLPHDVRPTSL